MALETLLEHFSLEEIEIGKGMIEHIYDPLELIDFTKTLTPHQIEVGKRIVALALNDLSEKRKKRESQSLDDFIKPVTIYPDNVRIKSPEILEKFTKIVDDFENLKPVFSFSNRIEQFFFVLISEEKRRLGVIKEELIKYVNNETPFEAIKDVIN